MNRSCVACSESKIRCDLNKTAPPCTRCLQRGWTCVRAERKKRARRTKNSNFLPSPQTGSEDGLYKVSELPVFDEQPVNLSFLDSCSPDEVEFLAQLADLENCVDLSSFTWTPQENPLMVGDHSLPRPSTGASTDEMGAPEIAMNVGYLCPDNFRLPADYALELEGPETVPIDRLETYARHFFAHFHPFFPLLHIPTFCLALSPAVLVRAICFTGAGFENSATSKSDAKFLHGSLSTLFAKCCLRCDKISPKLEELQAIVLFQLASMANGESAAERAASRLLHPLLVSVIRQAGLLKIHGECSKATRNAHVWQSWIEKESKKRVLWGVFTVDCYQSVLCGSKPLLLPTDTRASFPCDDPSWNAYSASSWAAMPAQDPSSCFLSSVKGLMVRQAPSESNLTKFGLNLLILSIHSLLLEAQTSILPVDLSTLEAALNTWHMSWEQFRRRSQHQNELRVGNLLIANSLSLYYLAFHFLRNGRPVLNERAYLEKSRVSGNPFIIREQVYQDEMTRCVREMLLEFQGGDNTLATLL
ncbi:hypothetical protein PDIG_51000 [Penicillium digitatum PHI26]|uniref:Zn(2)-C6 fungal-type domain-containing protein n=2 Tax=Penicillium digitatum TaxID=36651 RepID=K9FQ03_PEND2|nr:hypothetical protein PDIP_20220 [Penicillium digitatum Pd1]EKV11264.1 hypothetical protein PDIG_51000 [Penicillium digitatum PHI26]EKV20087.1 hypothetical protein PDIP_20220 [Penicillium digitatum Pd1]